MLQVGEADPVVFGGCVVADPDAVVSVVNINPFSIIDEWNSVALNYIAVKVTKINRAVFAVRYPENIPHRIVAKVSDFLKAGRRQVAAADFTFVQ